MKKTILMMAILMTLSTLGGCGKNTAVSSTDSTSTAASLAESAVDKIGNEDGESDIKYVGMCFPQLESPWFVDVKNQIVEALEADGIKVEVASADNNQARQIEIVENYGTKGVDGLILFPIGASEIGGTLESLQRQGIRVVTFVNKVDKGYDVMLMTDNLELGTITAKAAAEWIDATFPDAEAGSIEVGMLSVRMSPEANDVCDGMEKITEFTDKAKIVVEYEASFDNALVKAQENTEIMFTDYPNVKVILAYNNPLVVDEVVMRTSGIDYADFAVFSNTYDVPVVERMATKTQNNESVIRGISGAGYMGSWTHVADAMLGHLDVDEQGIAWDPLFLVTPENAKDFLD